MPETFVQTEPAEKKGKEKASSVTANNSSQQRHQRKVPPKNKGM